MSVNLVDVAWGSDRPSPPCNPLLILPLKYSGERVGGEGGGRRERVGGGGEEGGYIVTLSLGIIEHCAALLLSLSGRSWEDKVSDVRKEMEKNRASVLVVTALDEVACTPCHFLSLVKDLISTYLPLTFSLSG